ncbi:response regulator transcription factor [Novosphingobium sp.]|uniref:response regulator transcription factor n=1 Tax=Novosphingobium sp. TaxID=1874826 RepID=UPI002B49D284|nr:LuxR C-terminal-related transcriptional regulator [Novosphingobium sp.]HKR90790.1 LuxR C-terminal-related transcriptional regulator [Novosphingobium sp.]
MEHVSNLILIDNDTRRRAAISHALLSADIHVEPFENVVELAGAWPRSGVILIHDRPGAVEELIQAMAGHGEWFPIIAFGENPGARRIVDAVLDGAVDYIVWPLSSGELASTLSRAIERATAVGNAKLREIMARARLERLTRREREVLGGVASGLSNRLIAERLAISPRTVEIHRANMLHKLGANHTSEAIRIAIEAALVTRDANVNRSLS